MVNPSQYWQFLMDFKQLGFNGTYYADLVYVYILVHFPNKYQGGNYGHNLKVK